MSTKLLLRLDDETQKELESIKIELGEKTSSKAIAILIMEFWENEKQRNKLINDADKYRKIKELLS